ncbi:MAG TPA: CPBP family intramembrane glutamic endopeptidase [Pyrinomonadaceae bacterium]
MSTPLEPVADNPFADFAPDAAAPAAGLIDPDNPPWGVLAGFSVWLASIVLMVVAYLLVVIPYVLITQGISASGQLRESLMSDPNMMLLSVASVVPSHLATLLLVWAVVTNFGKRPFFRTIGWGWSPRFGLWTSAALAVLLLVLGGVLMYFLGRDVKTPFDEMLESSVQARFATAFLATATAPLVEELVYRGVLYPALRRAMGMFAAVVAVATLFTVVHVSQYYNNPAVIATVGGLAFALTYVRARTGRLLPCFVIHLVFNGIQCAWLVLEYFYPLPQQQPTETQVGLVVALLPWLL